jgi:hypothetical protein
MDPVVILNFIFCLIIVGLGYWAYMKRKSVIAIYIAITFGLFGISHLAILLGIKSSDISILVIRSIGYLVIIYALYKTALGSWNNK